MSAVRSREDGGATRRSMPALRAVEGLALAAAPTFALMGLITANDMPMSGLCAQGSGILPIDGMTAMYLLMSLFHLPPWLRLARRSRGAWPTSEGD